jgi:hypothetical protein
MGGMQIGPGPFHLLELPGQLPNALGGTELDLAHPDQGFPLSLKATLLIWNLSRQMPASGIPGDPPPPNRWRLKRTNAGNHAGRGLAKAHGQARLRLRISFVAIDVGRASTTTACALKY